MECELGNLVTDAMLARVQSQGVLAAIQNGGGIRASLPAGDITMGDVLSVLPFQNTLSTFSLRGEHIIEALENGVSRVEENAGRFPQVAGLRYSWSQGDPPGHRIRTVEIREKDEWRPVDPARRYLLVSNDYLRRGGDGYTMLRDHAENVYDFGPALEDVVVDFLSANPGYRAEIGSRINPTR
jgi:5'-nucleotidase